MTMTPKNLKLFSPAFLRVQRQQSNLLQGSLQCINLDREVTDPNSSRPSPAIPPEFGLDKFYDTVCVTNWREQLDKSEEKDKASLLPSLIMVEHTAIAIHYRLVMESNKRRANFLNRFPEIAAKPRDQLTSSDLENLNIIKRNEIEHAESKPTPDPDIIPKMKEVARYSGAEIEWMNHERREEAFTRLAAGESLDDMI